tara:strand:+ start:330 stop:575 length:246 start_codon:yes stop_codon:yes gene_type:complete
MKNEDSQKEIEKLRKQIKKTKKEAKSLGKMNKDLQDEIDSLWAMMDEINQSDIENWTHLLEQLKTDTVVKAMMKSKNKVEA